MSSSLVSSAVAVVCYTDGCYCCCCLLLLLSLLLSMVAIITAVVASGERPHRNAR